MSSCAHCESNLKTENAEVASKVFHVDLCTPGFKCRVFTSVPRGTQLQAIGRILTFRSPELLIAEKVTDPEAVGYTKLYVMFLEHSKKKIANAFWVLAQPENYPVLVHCIHGKDRTGMIVMLLLLLCEVDKEEIASEYMISSRCMLAWQQNGMGKNKLCAHLQTAAVLSVEKEYIDAAIEHIEGAYQGVANYLVSCGVDTETQQAVKKLLMTESIK